jgi:glutathione synthase
VSFFIFFNFCLQIFHFWMTQFHGLTRNRILKVDKFIAQLWQVHLKVKDEGYVQVLFNLFQQNCMLRPSQNLSLGLFRSDYMVHQSANDDAPTIKQVEFNTIASSFGGLSSQTSRLHKSVIYETPFTGGT